MKVTEKDSRASSCIYQAAHIMIVAGSEIEAARAALDSTISNLESSDVKIDGHRDGSSNDRSGWICLANIDSYNIRTRENGWRKIHSHISYIFDLGYRDGVASQFGRAVVIVAWSAEANDPWALDHFTFPIDKRSPVDETNDADAEWLEVVASGVVVCKHNDGISGWWYALPLEALAARSDVEDLLVRPLISQLAAMSFEETFDRFSDKTLHFQIDDERLVAAESCGELLDLGSSPETSYR